MLNYILFGFVVLVTHFLEGITGFGCTVLALPFAIVLVGINTAVPVLVVLGLLLCLYIVVISRKKIIWKEYIKILLFVGLGLPIGIILYKFLDEELLKMLLAIFMIVIAIRGLWVNIKKPTKEIHMPKFIMPIVLFLGGCFHGAFSSGGPLVVIYATKALPNKSEFRATMCMLWVTLNSIIFAQNIATGVMTIDIWKLLLISIPFLIVGAVLGNWAHHHIKDSHFTTVVYGVLMVSGVFMLC